MDVCTRTILEIMDMNNLKFNESLTKKISNDSVDFILKIIDSSKLYMNIGNRDKLTRNDIQNTLVLNGLEKLYGYSSKDLKMKDIKF